MSDLTERLRHAHVHSAQRTVGSNIFEEAADEIERLTAALAEARDRAMEEAANVADASEDKWDKIQSLTVYEERYGASMASHASMSIAAAIRALKEKP